MENSNWRGVGVLTEILKYFIKEGVKTRGETEVAKLEAFEVAELIRNDYVDFDNDAERKEFDDAVESLWGKIKKVWLERKNFKHLTVMLPNNKTQEYKIGLNDVENIILFNSGSVQVIFGNGLEKIYANMPFIFTEKTN